MVFLDECQFAWICVLLNSQGLLPISPFPSRGRGDWCCLIWLVCRTRLFTCSKINLVFWVPRVPIACQKVKWAFQVQGLEANCKYFNMGILEIRSRSNLKPLPIWQDAIRKCVGFFFNPPRHKNQNCSLESRGRDPATMSSIFLKDTFPFSSGLQAIIGGSDPSHQSRWEPNQMIKG